MSILSTTLIAMSMSTDAFAAALAKGVHLKKPSLSKAMRMGLIFGTVEFLMPLLGWVIGHFSKALVENYDHWVAFILLGLIGLKMIKEGLSIDEEDENQNIEAAQAAPKKRKKKKNQTSFFRTLITACSTSIDSLTIGVSVSFLSLDIWTTAIAIGLATFTMSSFGIMAGHYIGARIGKIAEIIGGAVLCVIGLSILLTHLGFI